jgi:hypothetical protein
MTISPRFERAISRGLASSRLARGALSIVLSACALVASAGAASASDDPASASGKAIFSARLAGAPTVRVATDAHQNVITAGSFEGNLDLEGARLSSEDESDIFVTKHGPDGNLLWAQRIGGAGAQFGMAVAADADGNVIVTGSTRGRPIPGSPMPSTQVFAAKLNAGGQPVWSLSFGPMHTGVGLGAAVSEEGEVTLVGRFSGRARSDAFVLESAPDTQNADAFIIRLTPNGMVRWGRALGGLGEQYAGAVAATPEGGVAVSGFFSGMLDIDGRKHESTGMPSAFVASFDRDGSARFSENLGPTVTDIPRLAADASGDIVVAGTFHSRLDLCSGTLISAGEDDVFAVKLDIHGAPLFAQSFGDVSSQQLGGVAIDGRGEIAVAMSSLGMVDLGAGPIEGRGGYDVAVVKLDPLGAPLWGEVFGDYQDQFASDVAVDGAGNIALVGQFAGSIDLGGGALQSTNGFDGFVAALTR